MIGRFWRWCIGNQKIEIDVNIKIKDLEKLIKVLSKSSLSPVIISNESHPGTTQNVSSVQTQGKKKLIDDPLTSEEAANIMLSDEIKKATDKTGNDVISASEGGSTDNTVSSLKKMLKGDQKNG